MPLASTLQIVKLLATAISVACTSDAAQMFTGDSYVAVTAHWISPEWELLSAVLGVAISNGTSISLACSVCLFPPHSLSHLHSPACLADRSRAPRQ
jgi:hypothetical protein